MAAGDVLTVPFCGACGFDANGSLHNDVYCDACGCDLTFFGFTGLFPPPDLAAALGTDEVVFTWTGALDTQDVQYQINGGEVVFDDDATSPYTVSAPAVAKVSLQVRTVLNGVAGPWSDVVSGQSGQSPPASLVATGGSLEVAFTFTADAAADSTDLSYNIDGGDEIVVTGVTTGVVVVAAAGETVTGKVRSVEDGVAGLYSATANADATA
jgi:hypothetical protein